MTELKRDESVLMVKRVRSVQKLSINRRRRKKSCLWQAVEFESRAMKRQSINTQARGVDQTEDVG